MTWLVTGGAGFIGAHVVEAMAAAGRDVVVLDDLSTGNAGRLAEGIPLVAASILDRPAVSRILREWQVDGVIHLAAKKQVGESVRNPLEYYRQNVSSIQTLLEAMIDAGVARMVFTSSSAVYGSSDVSPVGEEAVCRPMNPYGETKLVGERLLRAAAEAYPFRYVSLRLFNVAGSAGPRMSDTGSSLIPAVLQQITAGRRPVVFGADYDTPDGSCVRDYLHVADAAAAHLAAARHLEQGGRSMTANVGRGDGVSVREVIDLILETSGYRNLDPLVAGRRRGDPARMVADVSRIRDAFGWLARRQIFEIVESAWSHWRLDAASDTEHAADR